MKLSQAFSLPKRVAFISPIQQGDYFLRYRVSNISVCVRERETKWLLVSEVSTWDSCSINDCIAVDKCQNWNVKSDSQELKMVPYIGLCWVILQRQAIEEFRWSILYPILNVTCPSEASLPHRSCIVFAVGNP